jgi:MFS family permease
VSAERGTPGVAPHRRRAFQLLFVSMVSIGIGQSMLFSILPPAARDIGISPFQVSTVFATSAAIWVVVSPWWGRRSDVAGRRPIILTGLSGYALSMTLVATTITAGRAAWLPALAVYPCLVVSRSVFALLGSGTGPAAQAYVADRTTRVERGAAVAFLNAAMGTGETLGPGLGSLLASVGVTAPLYLSAALALLSAASIGVFLPEPPRHAHLPERQPSRLRARDRRVLPFIVIGAALQAVRATTIITLSLFLQDTLHLTSEDTVRRAGLAFVVLAASSLVAQLLLIQRLRPTSRQMLQTGVPLMLVAFVLLATVGRSFAMVIVAMVALGLGMGLVRPGSAAGASVSVEPEEQGGVAGLLGGVTVIGNVVGPMIGTSLYRLTPIGPALLNATLMTAVLWFVWRNPRVRALRV